MRSAIIASGTFEMATYYYWLPIARLKFDLSMVDRGWIFLGNFDYKAFRTRRAQHRRFTRYSGDNRSFSSLATRDAGNNARALVIISISINNANLSLRGIILGNDLESEFHCIVDPHARTRERFVRAQEIASCIPIV